VIGPILFLSVALVEGATRPGYDAVRQFVSLLSLGDGGWTQVVNFVVSGALIAAFGLGLRQTFAESGRGRWVPRLVILVGVALAWCGVFSGDPTLGYPAGAPAGVPSDMSWHAGLHYLGAATIFLGLPVATFITARQARATGASGFALHSALSGLVMLGGWIAGFVVVGPSGLVETAGLWQRIAIVAGFQWLVVVAALELRRFARSGAYAFA